MVVSAKGGRKTMPVWHAIKGLQKGVVESKCERCGAKIRIWPGNPKVCVKCFKEEEWKLKTQ